MKKAIAALAVSMAAIAAVAAPDGKRPMVLAIMVDGLRADAVQSGSMPNLEKLRRGERLSGFRAAWSLTALTAPGAAPSSAPNHVSIATGCAVAAHRVPSNKALAAKPSIRKQTWLERVAAAKAGAKTLFVFSWMPDANIRPGTAVEFMAGTDAANAKKLAARLASPDAPDATLYFIDCVDHAGHAKGFYPMAAEYLAASAKADSYIGACLDAIAKRPTFAGEDWLVLVTSDHGGYATGHGAIDRCNQATHSLPLVVAGRGAAAGRIPGCPRNYDVAACALAHFGIKPDDPDFTAKTVAGAQETGRDLSDGLVKYMPFDDGAQGGLFGNALALDGSADGAPAEAAPGGKCFTAAVWVKYDVARQPKNAAIFANKKRGGEGDAGAGAFLAARVEPVISRRVYTGAGFNAGDGAAALDIMPFKAEDASKWTFYAVTRGEDGVFTVYQGRSDGILGWTSGTLDGFAVSGAAPFRLGGAGFAGRIDDFALWSRGLSAGEVRSVFEAGRSGKPLGGMLHGGR